MARLTTVRVYTYEGDDNGHVLASGTQSTRRYNVVTENGTPTAGVKSSSRRGTDVWRLIPTDEREIHNKR